MTLFRVAATVLLTLSLVGCESTNSVHVDVYTEYNAGVEFVGLRTVIRSSGNEVVAMEEIEAPTFMRGRSRAADFLVASGEYTVEVFLLDGEDVRASHEVSINVDRNLPVTVSIRRSCADKACPGPGQPDEYTHCVPVGRCVPEGCNPDEPSTCPGLMPECLRDSDCRSPIACSIGRCEEQRCDWSGDDSRCLAGEYCDTRVGCLPVPCADDSDGCMGGATEEERQSCAGCESLFQTRSRVCDTRCNWGEWSEWSACMVSGSGGTRVLTGDYFSCALDEVGSTLRCWGANAQGQLGQGHTDYPVVSPVGVGADIRWSSVTVGYKHTCGVDSAGVGYCFGDNDFGQLGVGNDRDRSRPEVIADGHLWSMLSGGRFHTCGVDVAGGMWCWGWALEGRLGVDRSGEQRVPVQIGSGYRWSSVTAGEAHSCGVTVDGEGFCWGANSRGQLGVGDETRRTTPTAIAGDHRWRVLSAGWQHTCGIDLSGALYCWGEGVLGQLGQGNSSDSEVPIQVGTDSDWEVVSAGRWEHSCGIRSTGDLYCWGRNNWGQLGDGSNDTQRRPLQIPTNDSVVHVAVGWEHTCLVTRGGSVQCAGWGHWGQLGLGDRDPRRVPTHVCID